MNLTSFRQWMVMETHIPGVLLLILKLFLVWDSLCVWEEVISPFCVINGIVIYGRLWEQISYVTQNLSGRCRILIKYSSLVFMMLK